MEASVRRPHSLLSKHLAACANISFEQLINSYIQLADNVEIEDIVNVPLQPIESVMHPGLIDMIRDTANPHSVTPLSGDALRITSFRNHYGTQCIAYITATVPDRSELKPDDFQPNNLDVMLVITDALHNNATCFQLTDFVFSECRHPDKILEDSTSHSVIDGSGNEIFVHYQNIRAIAINVIERLARRGLDTPDPTKSAAIWLLAGIRQGVMWSHRHRIDIAEFIDKELHGN